jgi:hypothetical protein
MQTCLLNGINNLYGREVISFNDMTKFQELMDGKFYKPWRNQKVVEFAEAQRSGLNDAKVAQFSNSLLNGDSKGNWNICVLADYLMKYTNVKLVSCSKGLPYPLDIASVNAIVMQHRIVLIILEWFQYNLDQSHAVVYNNGVVLDGLLKSPIMWSECNYKNVVKSIYRVELNSDIRKK